VEAWLVQVRQQADAHKAQRLAIIEELKAWTETHADSSDWKAQIRELHAFSERWREAGHLSEKAFAEMQPVWKDCMHAAHARLEDAQRASNERRRALIAEAVELGAAPQLRIDAVKALQQQWQAEAHTVPLERKHEQKLWEAFRKPIDEAFARKSSEREKASTALNAHDQQVLDASRALDAAVSSGDVRAIRAAQEGLDAAIRGEAPRPAAKPAVAEAPAPKEAGAASTAGEHSEEKAEPGAGAEPAAAAEDTPDVASDAPAAEPAAPPAPAPAAPKKVVAVRGDDRPGMKKTEPAGRDDKRGGPRRDGRGDARGPGMGQGRPGRDERGGDSRGFRESRGPVGPRLGDAAFRAQRQALERADAALRTLAAQAHGEVLTEVMTAWEKRNAEQLPVAQALGSRVNAAVRNQWVQSLSGSAAASVPSEALLRLEMAAEVPTPAEHIGERRMLQLQLLTRRNEPAPAETWQQDVAQVLRADFDAAAARRLQAVLKNLLKK
ncbi:DUF349 domain-containing protein, partial [Hydrogenophaga sp.]|uniref:DUF349 domain-containing protein n=1 Tax=Hydrogenophaga sp. TaxID=1904254 RepID=UPI00356B0356